MTISSFEVLCFRSSFAKVVMSLSIILRFCAVGVIMLQYSIVPFLFILYSWNKVPLGASTAETPVPDFIFSFGCSSFDGGFSSRVIALFVA